MPRDANVHYKQRLAVLRSNSGAVDYALAPHSGTLSKLLLEQGSQIPVAFNEIDGPTIAVVEYCKHDIVWNELCGVCGADLSNTHYAESTSIENRVPVYSDAITFTEDEAKSAATHSRRNLLRTRRLSLVLDLDHTLVHASNDPRAAAIREFSPPDVDIGSIKSFSLGPSNSSSKSRTSASHCTMHVKLRPHLREFLQRVSKHFELSIYTMGIRSYAEQIARIIDPDNSLFRGRVTSREDFKIEGILNQKNLSRVFPCDDSMVLIIDDREDVWLDGTNELYMPNLLRAKPYYFWSGFSEVYDRASSIGGEPDVDQSSNIETGDFESVGKENCDSSLSEKNSASVSKEKNSRDDMASYDESADSCEVAHSNEILSSKSLGAQDDALVNGNGKETAVETQSPSEPGHPRTNIVDDVIAAKMRALAQEWWDYDNSPDWNDHLIRLAEILELVHERFYAQVEKNRTDSHVNGAETSRAPNIKEILAEMRYPVFEDCVFTFTGVFQLDIRPEDTFLWNAAVRHGAVCSNQFTSGVTTHVIASPERGASTEKSKRAVLENTAFCVSEAWLHDSLCAMRRLPELPYTIHPVCETPNWEEFRTQVDTTRAAKYKKLLRENPDLVSVKKRPFSPSYTKLPKRTKMLNSDGAPMPTDAVHNTVEQPVVERVLTGDEVNDILEELI